MRDLRSFGQPTRLVWRKRRWRCPQCSARSDRGQSSTNRSPRGHTC
ncbi:MAG: transposase family protein [Actinomycetia bacterium]|nr:transposase family protein [Actinomycetes bacterium]